MASLKKSELLEIFHLAATNPGFGVRMRRGKDKDEAEILMFGVPRAELQKLHEKYPNNIPADGSELVIASFSTSKGVHELRSKVDEKIKQYMDWYKEYQEQKGG